MTVREILRSHWGDDAFQRAIDAAGISLWLWNVDSDMFEMDPRGYELWDLSPGMPLTFGRLSEKIHPADRDRVQAAFQATRGVAGPYETDFRTMIGSSIRWISARGRGADEGIVDRAMMGVFLDVTGRKQAEESSELLAGEMSHRVKNLMTIASVLARVSSRSATGVEDMTEQFVERLAALGRAHDLVRPLPEAQGDAALLGDIFKVLLAPYDEQGAFAGRIRISLPRLGVGAAAAVSLALITHELATNALKHGSLSVPDGTLDVSGTVQGETVRIVWSERGGPDTRAARPGDGYGSGLVSRTVEGALGGTIAHDWRDEGALLTLDISIGRLAA